MSTPVTDHATHEHVHTHQPAPPKPAAPRRRLPTPTVVVNGVTVPRQAIAAEVQNFPARNPGEGWQAAARALVIRELLLQEARSLGIEASPQTDAEGRVETAEDALVRALVEQQVRVPEADEETLRRFYENNHRRFVNPALYEADHILVAARRNDRDAFALAREKAESLVAVLADAPERFAELARDCSDCTSASLGGSLGQISPGDTTPEFEAALLALEPGSISGPTETRYGIHLIRLMRRIEGRKLPFEAVRERIASYLSEHVRRQATAHYVALLVGRAAISGIAINGASTPLVQ